MGRRLQTSPAYVNVLGIALVHLEMTHENLGSVFSFTGL